MPVDWCHLVIRKISVGSVTESNFIAQYSFLALQTAFRSLQADSGVRSLRFSFAAALQSEFYYGWPVLCPVIRFATFE